VVDASRRSPEPSRRLSLSSSNGGRFDLRLRNAVERRVGSRVVALPGDGLNSPRRSQCRERCRFSSRRDRRSNTERSPLIICGYGRSCWIDIRPLESVRVVRSSISRQEELRRSDASSNGSDDSAARLRRGTSSHLPSSYVSRTADREVDGAPTIRRPPVPRQRSELARACEEHATLAVRRLSCPRGSSSVGSGSAVRNIADSTEVSPNSALAIIRYEGVRSRTIRVIQHVGSTVTIRPLSAYLNGKYYGVARHGYAADGRSSTHHGTLDTTTRNASLRR